MKRHHVEVDDKQQNKLKSNLQLKEKTKSEL